MNIFDLFHVSFLFYITFLQVERKGSSFNLHVDRQFSQHHFLNMLSFLHCMVLATLLKI
jgi:hypothetical protein